MNACRWPARQAREEIGKQTQTGGRLARPRRARPLSSARLGAWLAGPRQTSGAPRPLAARAGANSIGANDAVGRWRPAQDDASRRLPVATVDWLAGAGRPEARPPSAPLIQTSAGRLCGPGARRRPARPDSGPLNQQEHLARRPSQVGAAASCRCRCSLGRPPLVRL